MKPFSLGVGHRAAKPPGPAVPVPGARKGRVAANEILVRTPGLPNLIREGNTAMINSLIQSGRKDGMQTMDDALFALIQAGRVDPREAYRKATDKARFESLAPSD